MNKRTPTKQKLLNILKKDHRCTIKDIMVYFTISEIAVRKHIHELEQQGFIRKISNKQDIGRPFYMYELTDKGHKTFPNQYEKLPLELLRDLEDLQGTKMVDSLLEKRMEREASFFKQEIKTEDFDDKIAEVARIQDEKGYMVEYEKQEDGSYEMKNFNCPIINIASTYQKVCTNEKEVLKDIFQNSDVLSYSCITEGDHYCKWKITKPKHND